MMAGETKSGSQKKADDASTSLGQFANPNSMHPEALLAYS